MERQGNGKSAKCVWRQEDIEYLRDHIEVMTFEQIGQHLGCSFTTVRLKADELGIRRKGSIRARRWTQEQLDYLMASYTDPTKTVNDIAMHIGCSDGTIQRKAAQLGLKRPDSYDKRSFYGRYVRGYETTNN